jgi:hypothetical protein
MFKAKHKIQESIWSTCETRWTIVPLYIDWCVEVMRLLSLIVWYSGA